MLKIERIPTLGDNYTYLVICEDTGEAAAIDAPEAARSLLGSTRSVSR